VRCRLADDLQLVEHGTSNQVISDEAVGVDPLMNVAIEAAASMMSFR